MALLEHNLECDECHTIFDGVRAVHKDPEASYRILCSKCLGIVEENEKTQWLNKLRKGKTTEERISAIEEWMYFVTKGLGAEEEVDK